MTSKILAHRAGRFAAARSSSHDFPNGNGGPVATHPVCDARRRPHARGGDHRMLHGRDGNPKG